MSLPLSVIPISTAVGGPLRRLGGVVCWMMAWWGCASESPPVRFEPVPVGHSGIDFRNSLGETPALHILRYIYYYNGAGVGVADFDKDGWEDIFFAGNETTCRLYRNLGGLRFEDRTAAAGLTTRAWCTGVAVADVDADGWSDIYVCAAGYPAGADRRNLLFINQTGRTGRLSFTEAAVEWGLADTAYSTQAAFFDFDRDGDLDMYLLNHANERDALNTPTAMADRLLAASRDRLYRNEGGRFREVSDSLGISHTGNGLGLAVGDFDRDGWPDIFVANDFIAGDRLYRNAGGRHFVEQAADAFRHQSYNSMGCDAADVNNDLLPDLFVADMLPAADAGRKRMAGSLTLEKWQTMTAAGFPPQVMRNVLQLAVPMPETASGPAFTDVARQKGLAATDWSWAPLWADLDNDGAKDLFLTTGYPRDIVDRDFLDYSRRQTLFMRGDAADSVLWDLLRQRPGRSVPNRFFHNTGTGDFRPVPGVPGEETPPCSQGAAWADFDRDGDLDLVVNNINAPASLLENIGSPRGNHLAIRLVGPTANPDGVGARLVVYTAGRRQLVEQWPQRGYLSSVSPLLHIGIGAADHIDSLRITWPDGRGQSVAGPPAGRLLVLAHGEASPPVAAAAQPMLTPALFREAGAAAWGLPDGPALSAAAGHSRFPPLALPRCETGRPVLLAADLDQDDRTELFLAGVAGQPPALFALNPDAAHFLRRPFLWPADTEVTAACFLDLDQDGWPDLAVATHGPDSAGANLLVYPNDRHGRFPPTSRITLPLPGPVTALSAADFDRDGDEDLFAGGGPLYDQYPRAAESLLLENTGKGFRIVPKSMAPDFGPAGIVRSASWMDMDGDGWKDLLTVGEWNSPRLWRNHRGSLQDVTRPSGLADYTGWWQTLLVVDLDRDGDPDFVAGNIGDNTAHTQAGIDVLRLYDVPGDGQGRSDIVAAYRSDGVERPCHGRNELLRHLAGLDRKFPTHAAFSTASMKEVLGKDRLEKAQVWEMGWFPTTIFRNDGTGRFAAESLPPPVQAAPVFALLAIPSKEGPGLLVAGNSHAFDVPEPQADALPGLLLSRDDERTYRCRWPDESGIYLPGSVRALAFAKRGAQQDPLVLALQSDGRLQVFETTSGRYGSLR